MLTNFQKILLPLLAANRNESSYVAGGTLLNVSHPRNSQDIDIFHDDTRVCRKAFQMDTEMLKSNGYDVETIRTPEKNGIGEVVVSDAEGNSTLIQWAVDSAYRFFPVEVDPEFGFKLNYHDLATNKILALAGRAEVRDYYDMCEMIRTGKPVAAYVWAACAKDPGYSPTSLLEYMSFNSRYQADDFEAIDASKKMTIGECKELFLGMFHSAVAQFKLAPLEDQGVLYLTKEDHTVFFPSAEDFASNNFLKHNARAYGSVPQFADCGEDDEDGASPLP